MSLIRRSPESGVQIGPIVAKTEPNGFKIELGNLVSITFRGRRGRNLLRENEQKIQGDPIIFLSDFGYDHAPLECKLIMNAIFADAKIQPSHIFEAHHIEKFNLDHASQVLGQVTKGATKDTKVLAVIDPGVGSDGENKRRNIIIQTNNGVILVGPDNGIFSQVIERDGVSGAWELNLPILEAKRRAVVERLKLHLTQSTTFDGRDRFSPAIAFLACGTNPNDIGVPIEPKSLITRELPDGVVVDGDTYGDLKVKQPIPEGAVAVYLQREDSEEVRFPIKSAFGQVPYGHPVALLSSNGHLELAYREINAAQKLGIKIGDRLKFRWELIN